MVESWIGPELPEPPPLPERRVYPNDPITEGLVQFTFAEPIPWTIATPGTVYEAIKYDYPAEPEAQAMLEAAFNPQANPQTGGPAFSVTSGMNRIIYKNEARTRLLVLGPTTYGVNSLKPYEGWDSLANRMTRGLDALRELLPLPAISEVAVRYINLIEIQRGRDTQDFITFGIRTARSSSSYLQNFVLRVQSLLPDGFTTAGVTYATPPQTSEAVFPLLLDIEFKRQIAGDATTDEAKDIAHELKRLENGEFESLITDAARELFA